jgi:hypothetical protein
MPASSFGPFLHLCEYNELSELFIGGIEQSVGTHFGQSLANWYPELRRDLPRLDCHLGHNGKFPIRRDVERLTFRHMPAPRCAVSVVP